MGHDHDHVVVELVDAERAGDDAVPPKQVRERHLVLDRPALYLVEPRVTERTHPVGVASRDAAGRPQSEVLRHPLGEVMLRLVEQRLVAVLRPVVAVLRFLKEAVAVLRMVPQHDVVMGEPFANQPQEPVVKHMDRAIDPQRCVAIRVEIRSASWSLRGLAGVLARLLDDVAPP